jgi:hypothetical protein
VSVEGAYNVLGSCDYVFWNARAANTVNTELDLGIPVQQGFERHNPGMYRTEITPHEGRIAWHHHGRRTLVDVRRRVAGTLKTIASLRKPTC